MIYRVWPSVAAVAIAATCSPSFRSQPKLLACADASSDSANLLRVLHDAVFGTDSSSRATRTIYHVDSGAPIVVIHDSEICAHGAAAYSQMAGDTGTLARQRRVLVVRVGDKYVVDDPYTPAHAGEFELWAIFDKKWHFVVGLAS